MGTGARPSDLTSGWSAGRPGVGRRASRKGVAQPARKGVAQPARKGVAQPARKGVAQPARNSAAVLARRVESPSAGSRVPARTVSMTAAYGLQVYTKSRRPLGVRTAYSHGVQVTVPTPSPGPDEAHPSHRIRVIARLPWGGGGSALMPLNGQGHALALRQLLAKSPSMRKRLQPCGGLPAGGPRSGPAGGTGGARAGSVGRGRSAAACGMCSGRAVRRVVEAAPHRHRRLPIEGCV